MSTVRTSTGAIAIGSASSPSTGAIAIVTANDAYNPASRAGHILTTNRNGACTWQAPSISHGEVAQLLARLDRLERMVEAMWDAPGMPGQQRALADSEDLLVAVDVAANKAPSS